MVPNRAQSPNNRNTKTSTCLGTTNKDEQANENSGFLSDPDVKGLLQSTEFELNLNKNSGKCQSFATQSVAILEFEQGWRGTESSWKH